MWLALRRPGSRGEQFRQFSEIERSHIEGELCPDIGHAAQHRLGDLADRHAPAERLLDLFALPLAHGVARVVRRSMAEPLTLAATCGVTHMRRKTAMKSEAS